MQHAICSMSTTQLIAEKSLQERLLSQEQMDSEHSEWLPVASVQPSHSKGLDRRLMTAVVIVSQPSRLGPSSTRSAVVIQQSSGNAQ